MVVRPKLRDVAAGEVEAVHRVVDSARPHAPPSVEQVGSPGIGSDSSRRESPVPSRVPSADSHFGLPNVLSLSRSRPSPAGQTDT